ncbi:MAG: sigma-70 family RNA polymerase sigma factor, partial [Lachnospiraceae bacterium]|nr:sigma-70 family RNA polymerase sigma factor [Lachnospiraceae bacterium]
KTAREVSLYEPIGTDKEGNEINLLDVIEGQQIEVVDRIALYEDLQKLFSLLDECLTDREKEILFLRYGISTGEEVTQSEIGKKLGISRSYVSRIEKKALGKLKEAFERKTEK